MKGKLMKTLIIVPAYNEGENIERVINNLKDNFSQYDYIVINDGSRDNTEQICRQNGYNYISHPVNLGLAGAFRTGMKYALKEGYDAAIQFDGDGQHNPNEIPDLLKPIIDDGADFVNGSRYMNGPEENTPAASMPDQIPEEVKEEFAAYIDKIRDMY